LADTESVEDNSLLSMVILIGDLLVVVEVDEAFKKSELTESVLVPDELELLVSDVILFWASSF